MSKNRRTAARKTMPMPAYLYTKDGWPLGECEIKDVSETGAKLSHLSEDELPGELLLSFSRNGSVRRLCRVVWRAEKQVGVHFSEAKKSCDREL